MHLYKDDHIKDVQSTCRGSCNTRMECWWLTISSTPGIVLIFYISFCTQWGEKQKYSCLSPFLLAVLLWSRQARSKNKSHPLSLVHGRFPPGASSLSAIRLSVHSSINTLCVCSFCVGLFYSALPLYKSTVARGQSLGIGKKEGFHGVQGFITNTLLSRMVGIQRAVSVCVGGVGSFLAVQVTTLTKHKI